MKELEIITKYYGDRKAERSGVPLINHITEGLEILNEIGASMDAKRAYCLHPLLQNDDELRFNYCMPELEEVGPIPIILAMEYRNVANAYLSKREIRTLEDIKLSHMIQVNHMLYADKVQNQKDFLIYHADSHPRAEQLKEYFENWINKLEKELNIVYLPK